MRTIAAALCILAATTVQAGAQSLVCFGNEPNWSITFNTPDRARVTVLGTQTREFRGRETRNEPLRERVWRGRAAGGPELVLFIQETACSDGMSDEKYPMSARASLPDGSFLVGCCRVPGRPAGTAALEGTSWRLVSLTGQNSATLNTLGMTMQFQAGRISGFSGCNRFTGSYTQDRNRLTLKPLAGTMMACLETVSTVERSFTSALTGTLTNALVGDRLTLTAASGSVLVFEREAISTLEGKTWRITGYNNGRQAVVSPIQGTELTLSFANGTVSGQAGCNTFRAPYTQEGSRITIKAAATTRKMCSEDVMAQERDFLKALESVIRWRIEGDELDMHRADEERALTAKSGEAK